MKNNKDIEALEEMFKGGIKIIKNHKKLSEKDKETIINNFKVNLEIMKGTL